MGDVSPRSFPELDVQTSVGAARSTKLLGLRKEIVFSMEGLVHQGIWQAFPLRTARPLSLRKLSPFPSRLEPPRASARWLDKMLQNHILPHVLVWTALKEGWLARGQDVD